MNVRYACLALVLVVAGCGSKSDTVVTEKATVKPAGAEAPAGWQTVKTASFSIALPKDWQVIDMTSGDMDKMLSGVSFPKDDGGKMKQQILALAKQGIFKLYAFGPNKDNNFQENLNVNVTPAGGMTDLKVIKDASEKQMATLAKETNSSIESNPDRIVLNSVMETQTPNGAVTYATHAHMLIHNDQCYTFTFSTSPSNRSRIEGIAKDAVKTITFP